MLKTIFHPELWAGLSHNTKQDSRKKILAGLLSTEYSAGLYIIIDKFLLEPGTQEIIKKVFT